MPANSPSEVKIPWFGARKVAVELAARLQALEKEHASLRAKAEKTGALSIIELEKKKSDLQKGIVDLVAKTKQFRVAAQTEEDEFSKKLAGIRTAIVETEELSLLQEAGVYRYRHPLTDAVQYESRLAVIEVRIKDMAKHEGGAIQCAVRLAAAL